MGIKYCFSLPYLPGSYIAQPTYKNLWLPLAAPPQEAEATYHCLLGVQPD